MCWTLQMCCLRHHSCMKFVVTRTPAGRSCLIRSEVEPHHGDTDWTVEWGGQRSARLRLAADGRGSKEKRRTREASDSASQDFCQRFEVDHSCPRHLTTPTGGPRPLRLGGRRGKEECMLLTLDLDAFQKSTPYALVTEWIIQRYGDQG